MKEIHLVCNAHIDPIWQWDVAEGVSATLSTFRSAADLCDKYDYVFCHNEVTVYKYVEEYAPDLFKRIQGLVKAGKWHIMGGWYLQPDCNMPSGESIVRQIEEGRRYFMEKFGVYPTTAVNFDPFGHTVGLVQIIKKCGQDGYFFMRPYPNELTLPSEQFIWRGLDGSEIKAARTGPYNSPLGSSAEVIKERAEEQNLPVGLVTWGVGNHGGGPSDKDLSDIERELLTSEDVKYIHSTPEEFFRRAEPTAVFDKSLHISMPGCYTSMYRVKSRHAKLESELYFAEKIAATAYARGLLDEYPEARLHEITEDLLNAEFHDVLPGTSVQCGEEAGIRYLDHGLLEAERVKLKAYFALSSEQKPSSDGEFPILVFNPHPYELSDNVECEFMLADQNWDEDIVSHITVRDESGRIIPHQLIKEESNLNLDWRKRIIFEAKLKPLDLTRFSVYINFAPKTEKNTPSALVFDNGRKRVVIDEVTGLLSSYKLDGVEYLDGGVELVSFEDNADPWAMGADQLERVGRNERSFTLSKHPTGVFTNMKSVQVIEDGDIYLGVEAFFEQDNTRARIGYKIYKNNDYVDIDVTIFLGDIDRIVKLKLPVANSGRLLGQTAFGSVELFCDGRENVAHRFVAAESSERWLSLMNTGVYGSHFESGAIYMSLLRGVTYCAHPIRNRQLIPKDRFTKKIDQGESSFSFRLAALDRAELERRAVEFVQKPFAQNIFPVPSTERSVKSFSVSLDDEIITVAAMKKADGREAVILRLQNGTENGVDTVIRVSDASLPLSFGRYEVKTILFENGRLVECDRMII